MLPSFHEGDKIVVDVSEEARSNLRDGDVIVIRRDNGLAIKRILAIAGETISGADRKVFRNGKQLDEPYLAPVSGKDTPLLTSFAPHTVGPGELFVMGDYRDRSADSRLKGYGPVKTSDVIGKYSWTYWHAISAPNKN